MAARIKNGKVDMNRNLYQDIKKYDRETMQNFLDDIYETGLQTGLKSVSENVFDINKYIAKIGENLQEIKGIGAKKAAEIVALMQDLSQN